MGKSLVSCFLTHGVEMISINKTLSEFIGFILLYIQTVTKQVVQK